jgi:Protein of unknown function (DUF2853)
MAEVRVSSADYASNVKQYALVLNNAALAGIVRHLGIALRGKDSALVAASDPGELTRLREGFMKKKLGLTQSDRELDTALKDILGRMATERGKSRVTVCYLLAEKFGKLSMFG